MAIIGASYPARGVLDLTGTCGGWTHTRDRADQAQECASTACSKRGLSASGPGQRHVCRRGVDAPTGDAAGQASPAAASSVATSAPTLAGVHSSSGSAATALTSVVPGQQQNDYPDDDEEDQPSGHDDHLSRGRRPEAVQFFQGRGQAARCIAPRVGAMFFPREPSPLLGREPGPARSGRAQIRMRPHRQRWGGCTRTATR